LRPLVLPPADAPLFAVVHEPAPDVAARGGILLAPPLGEEMNRCRLAVAAAARRFSALGWTTLVVDLYGTGDSAGDFGEATVERWCDDLRSAWSWLRERADGEAVLWALRGGALLALSLREELRPHRLVLWSPVLSGREAVDAVLRLASAGEALGPQDGKAPARQRIRDEGKLEIGGYCWSEALLAGLEALRHDDRRILAEGVLWLDVPGRAERQPGAGGLQPRAIEGAAFWRAAEPVAADAWAEATAGWLQAEAT